MARKRKETNFRVVVYPSNWTKDNDYSCKNIKKEIERHVDNFNNIDIDSDTIYFCEFCNTEWSEKEYEDLTEEEGCCKRHAESAEELLRLAQQKAKDK